MTTKSARLIQVFLLSIGSFAIATPAHAQDDLIESAVAHVGLGAGVNFYRPSSDDADSSQGIVIMYRWHNFHSGWGPTFGLDWHSTDFHQPVGNVVDVPMGSLRMRALLAGFGYRHLSTGSTLRPSERRLLLQPSDGRQWHGSGIRAHGVSLLDARERQPPHQA